MTEPSRMEPGEKKPTARRVTRSTRVFLLAQVGVAALLAVGTAVLAIDVSDWWFFRVDLSVAQRNSLDAEVVEVIERLPAKVEIDVFPQPFDPPFYQVTQFVQQRMLEVLSLVSTAHRDRIDVQVFGPEQVEAAQVRQDELGVRGENLMVFTCGGRKATVSLVGDVAVIDWGNPHVQDLPYLIGKGIVFDHRKYSQDPRAYRPARMSEFRGEEVFVENLLKVASGASPRVVFSVGHGEPDLEGTTTEDLSRLKALLAQDGFEVDTWDPEATGHVLPEEVDILVLAGAQQPLGKETVEAVKAFVEAGGRLLGAPHRDEAAAGTGYGISTVLASYGMISRPGRVCQPVVDPLGRIAEGTALCADFRVGENRLATSHPLTEIERRHGRKLAFANTPALEARTVAGGRRPLPLVYVPADAWLDLPDPSGLFNYVYEHGREERSKQLALVCGFEMPARLDPTKEVRRGRVLGAASVGFLTNSFLDSNRYFVLNAFNWLAEREHRMRVTPLNRAESFLDLQRSRAMPILTYGLWLVLPGLCIAVGGFLAWRRRQA